jgi:hypothetical protein
VGDSWEFSGEPSLALRGWTHTDRRSNWARHRQGKKNIIAMFLKIKGRKKICEELKISLDRILESGILADIESCAPAMPGRFAF